MTGCRLECAWEVRPWILRVVRTFHWLRHNLNLCDTLATLSVGRTDTVATRVTTTDYQHILTLGVNQFVLLYFDTGEHPVLLSEHFECEINTLEFTSGYLQVAGSRSTSGDYVSVITLRQLRHVDFLTETELDALLSSTFIRRSMIALLSLKLGMPYLSNPPAASFLSYTVTVYPLRLS